MATNYNRSCGYCDRNRYLCSFKTFWDGQSKCINQCYGDSSLTCQSDHWCRGKLNLTCQFEKYQSMSVVTIPVINATVPYLYSRILFAFDNYIYSMWNAQIDNVSDYLLVTSDNFYLLSSFQLTIFADAWHDPRTIHFYMYENATYLEQSFSFLAILSMKVKMAI
ncbi:hypothetical protein I4U23_004212 [Adineta vaga]|nr:hypothetical protein I4U23_004212 [Adineta vaga]